MEEVTVGRTVHYVLTDGQHRPATVVRTFPGYDGVNLVVLLDGTNDSTVAIAHGFQAGALTGWATSVKYSEGKEPFTWHWPERV